MMKPRSISASPLPIGSIGTLWGDNLTIGPNGGLGSENCMVAANKSKWAYLRNYRPHGGPRTGFRPSMAT